MLPKKNRLTTKDFNEVMEKGRVIHSSLFLVKYIKYPGESAISVAIPAKVAKTAVLRNKFRREVYDLLRPMMSELNSDLKIALIGKSPLLSASKEAIVAEIKSIFVKGGIMK